jgi:FemAB-related protein (PEP-CTERM system-associated)
MAIPRKQRAMIRKGIKAGLVAEVDDDTDRLYEAMLECKRNLGTPFFGRRWLQAIKKEFGEQAEITTVTHDGNTVCSVMSFRFRDEILPYYGGGGDLARDLKGNDFMYWAVMEKACRAGVAVFDYGRSSVGSGAYRFKKHWGFEPKALHYQIRLVNSESAPELSPSNPRYDRAIRTWKKLPPQVAALIGPPIARRLG